jgi:hypothetical protein
MVPRGTTMVNALLSLSPTRFTDCKSAVPGSYVPKDGEADAHGIEHAPVVTTDDEGNEMPESAVKASMKESYVSVTSARFYTRSNLRVGDGFSS